MPSFVLIANLNFMLPAGSVILLILGFVALLFYYRKFSKEKAILKDQLEDANALYTSTVQELDFIKHKAEQSDKLKSSFLANMSHEIRTPLNAIMGFSSLLQTPGDDDAENQQYIEIIHRNSNKLLDMMDEIFNIALIESGITSLYKEECQINELLTSLVTYFNMEKELNEQKDVSIRVKKPTRENAFSINTDPRKLRQTLYNLIENALKYTSSGYIEVGYELKEHSMIEFYVKDTGLGFPQEKLDIVFQRFRQVDDSNTRNFGGIGLGLTLSQKFVEMLGGQMRGESTPGVGSTFYFTIPYEPVNEKVEVNRTENMNLESNQ
jgi:signal transduction histidine kinase